MFVHMYLYIYFKLFLFLIFNLSLMRRNFNLVKPKGTFLSNPKCTVFLSAPSWAVLNQPMPLFLNFGPFHTQPIYSYFVFLSAVSPAISRWVFLFEILRVFPRFSRFFEILRDFRYFSFLFLSSRTRNHIFAFCRSQIYLLIIVIIVTIIIIIIIIIMMM